RRAGAPVQPLDAGYGAVHHAGKLGVIFRRAALAQALLGLVGGKPGAISVELLRRVEPCDLTQMSVDGRVFVSRIARIATLAAKVAGERNFLHAAMGAGFLESLE